MTFATMRDLQQSIWDAECRRDMTALLAHFHPEATFHPAGGSLQVGHAAIQAMTEAFYATYAELAIDIVNEWNGDVGAAIFEFRAHLVDNDGARSTLDGVCAVESADGLVTAVRYYEDSPVPAA